MIDYKNAPLTLLLRNEIAQIDDPDISSFVSKTLDTEVNPCHAWKPASSTGKYHPKFALGDGGLIRHIKVVTQNVIEFVRATPPLQAEKDTLVAAAVLHDMWKYPVGRDNKFTAFDHPKLGGDYCIEHGFPEIGRLIKAHQGIWTTNRNMPGFENEQPRKFDEWVLHYADLLASRKYLDVQFDDIGEIVLTEENSPKPEGRTIIS